MRKCKDCMRKFLKGVKIHIVVLIFGVLLSGITYGIKSIIDIICPDVVICINPYLCPEHEHFINYNTENKNKYIHFIVYMQNKTYKTD